MSCDAQDESCHGVRHINRTAGKVNERKGIEKGTYSIEVKVSAAGRISALILGHEFRFLSESVGDPHLRSLGCGTDTGCAGTRDKRSLPLLQQVGTLLLMFLKRIIPMHNMTPIFRSIDDCRGLSTRTRIVLHRTGLLICSIERR